MKATVNLKIKTIEIVGGEEHNEHYYLMLSGNNISGTIKLGYKPDIAPGTNLCLTIDNPQSVLVVPETESETDNAETKPVKKTRKTKLKKLVNQEPVNEPLLESTNQGQEIPVIPIEPVTEPTAEQQYVTFTTTHTVTSATEDGIVLS